MELQSNYEAIKSLNTEIIAIAQEERDASTLAKVHEFVQQGFPVVADPERASWETFSRYGVYLVDKEGVIRVVAEGSKEARPRLDLLVEALAKLEGKPVPAVQFGGARTGDEPGTEVDGPESVLSSRWMWSHNVVRSGDDFKLALLPTLAPGYHAYGSQEEMMIPFKVEVELPDGIALAGPIGYPRGEKFKDEALGTTHSILEGDIPLGALLFKAAETVEAGEVAVKVKLHYQACDDSMCFAPVTKILTVPLRIAGKETMRQQVFGWNTW